MCPDPIRGILISSEGATGPQTWKGIDMNTTTTTLAELVYRAELALEDARATGVDAWIKAAADRLHEVLVRDAAAVLRAA
jgi:hypothetical protein